MSSGRKFWGQRTFVLITGASQGIGQCIAVEFCKHLGPGSKILLVARSLKGLEETKKKINDCSAHVEVQIECYDLSKPDIVELKEMVCKHMRENYELNLLIHNAGTEGDGQSAEEMNDLQYWQCYMTLNLYSMTMLTNAFLDHHKTFKGENKIAIVNITSLGAVQPIKGMGHYCIGKASREMYFRTLAEECPDLDILNYSPGPVKTDMVDRLINKMKFTDVKEMFVGMRDNDKLVTAEDTTAKLIKLLAEGDYKSGGRVDYFDRP